MVSRMAISSVVEMYNPELVALCKAPSIPAVTRPASLDIVASYVAPAVEERIARDLGLDHEEAAELFHDLKRFLWLASVANSDLVPTKIIDAAWHIFIQTDEYRAFCDDILGANVEHSELDGASLGSDVSKTLACIDRFLRSGSSENWAYH